MRFIFISHGITPKIATKMIDVVGKRAGEARVVYITTAANTYPPNPEWLREAKADLKKVFPNLETFDLEEAHRNGMDLEVYFKDKDAIFFSGGNSFYLLYWIRETGFDVLLKKLLEKGVVYGGESAGVVCQIKDLTPVAWLDNPKLAPEKVEQGLGFTDLVVLPHWNNPKYSNKLEKTKKYYEDKGLKVETIENGQAIFEIDGRVEKVV